MELTLELELGMDVATIDRILDQHERSPSAIIAVLQDLQDEVNYLPEGALRYVAEQIGIPESKVYSLATFYRQTLLPRVAKQVTRLPRRVRALLEPGAVPAEPEA